MLQELYNNLYKSNVIKEPNFNVFANRYQNDDEYRELVNMSASQLDPLFDSYSFDRIYAPESILPKVPK